MGPVLARRIDLNPTVIQVGSLLLVVGALLLPLLPGHGGVICPLRATTGIPCPLCGMTTSVTATGRGRFEEAIAANPGGLLAVAIALLVILIRPRSLRVPAAPLIAVVVAMWVFELFRFSVL